MNTAQVRRPWLLMYVVVNLIAACFMFDSGELVGDLVGKPLYSVAALVWALILVVSSYYLILGPLFNFLVRMKVKPLVLRADDEALGRKIGTILLLLQCAYFAFNTVNGVNMAGAEVQQDSVPFAMFWVFLPVDTMIVVYYGCYRNNRMFYPNLLVWLISNLARGWSGMFLFVIFFEWCRMARGGRVKWGRILAVGAVVVVCYPVLINLKWIIRASSQAGIGLAEVQEGLSAMFASADYLTLIGDGLMQIVGRFQTTANVVEVMRIRELLQDEYGAGQFTPFWREGLHGIALERLYFGARSVPIGIAFTDYAALGHGVEVGSWNTNIGYVGWLFIAPWGIPLYLLYTLLLGYISVFLMKKLGQTAQTADMIWLTWLLYLLPPWHAMFVGFLYAMTVFLGLRLLIVRTGAMLRPRQPA